MIRHDSSSTLTVTAAQKYTPAFSVEYFAAGCVVPIGWTSLASFTVEVSDTEDGTFYDLLDKDGNAVSITVGALLDEHAMPEEIFAAKWVKLEGNTNAPAGGCTCIIMLKS